MKSLSPDAAFRKLCLIAEIIHPDNRKAQKTFLFRRASDQTQGMVKGDNSALHIAIATFSWLAKDAVDGQ